MSGYEETFWCNREVGHAGAHAMLPGSTIHAVCDVEFTARPCGTVRPDTLGYQACRYPEGHIGAHKSQDSKTWTVAP